LYSSCRSSLWLCLLYSIHLGLFIVVVVMVRLTGYSPFQGETHQETFLNVSQCDYDFEDDIFDVVSPEAKDFIELLLIKAPR